MSAKLAITPLMLLASLGVLSAHPPQARHELVRVTTDEANDYHPRWAPDGRSIMFTSQRGGRIGLWLIGWPPGDPVPMETGLTGDHNFSWSPDGEQIAFDAQTDQGAPAIWIIGANGGGPRRLDAAGTPSFQPSWSPDGRSLAFVSYRSGNSDIWLLTIEELETRRGSEAGVAEAEARRAIHLTRNAATDHHPVWSADGRDILFVSDRDGDFDIWSVRGGGGDPTPVVGEPTLIWGGPGRDDHPAPSPDGKWLAFSSEDSGERVLRLLSRESGESVILLRGPVIAWPSWSPDSTMIAFVAGTESNMDIWVLRVPSLPLP